MAEITQIEFVVVSWAESLSLAYLPGDLIRYVGWEQHQACPNLVPPQHDKVTTKATSSGVAKSPSLISLNS